MINKFKIGILSFVILSLIIFTWFLSDSTFQLYAISYPFKSILFLKIVGITLVLISTYVFYKTNLIFFVCIWAITLCYIFSLIFLNNNIFVDFYGDFWYMNALVTKYKYYNGWLLDSTIKDIPSYLAPLYFFVLGTISKLFNLQSYNALMYGSCCGVLITPFLVYILLKDRFSDFVISIAVVIIPVFFQYEISMKPYQTISALLSLIFYYKIICSEKKIGFKEYFIYIIFGIILFLLYYYSFVYLAVAFFVDRIYCYYQNKTIFDAQSIRNFIIYAFIGLIGFLIFVLPHLLAIKNAGSSNSIFYLATTNLYWSIFDATILIGLIQIFKTLKSSDSKNTLVIFISVSLLFIFNFLNEFFVGGDLSVIKIIHIFSLIVIPYTISFIVNYISENKFTNPKSVYVIILGLISLFSINKWVDQYVGTKLNTEKLSRIDLVNEFEKQFELKNKVIFSTYFHDFVEIGALTPAYFFTPINIDYASPASKIKERIEFVKSFENCTNPALFALKFYNNKIQKIDYLYWNSKNVFAMPNQYRMGEQATMNEFSLKPSIISKKYFINPCLKYQMFEINYLNDFANKKIDECTFLENLAMNRVDSNAFQFLMNDLKNNTSKYSTQDIFDTKNFLIESKSFSDLEINSFMNFLANNVAKYPQFSFRFEAENLPSLINDPSINSIPDIRKVSPQTNLSSGNVIVYGPYCNLPKGKYRATFKIKTNTKILEKNLNFDVFVESANQNKSFGFNINQTKELMPNIYNFVTIDFSVESSKDIIQTRCYFYGNYELEIDYIDIIPLEF